jgi:hypothetical protein
MKQDGKAEDEGIDVADCIHVYKRLMSTGFPIKILHPLLISLAYATCTTYLIKFLFRL